MENVANKTKKRTVKICCSDMDYVIFMYGKSSLYLFYKNDINVSSVSKLNKHFQKNPTRTFCFQLLGNVVTKLAPKNNSLHRKKESLKLIKCLSNDLYKYTKINELSN